MAEKKLTPIQEALIECNRLASKVAQTGDGLRICREMKSFLQSLLLKEKEFAKEMFDKGNDLGGLIKFEDAYKYMNHES